MHTFKDINDWRTFRQSKLAADETIGFVPTMGALHPGHLSLVERSVAENDRTVASIFVNPTQFNETKDLQEYPRDLEKDSDLLEKAGVDWLIFPDKKQMYSDNYRYSVVENEVCRRMEGIHRPGHFEGVMTVVMKLLNIVKPTKAYFGKKDYQQLSLIQDMVNSFFMDVEIVPCETVRESDGLAMSSRNLLLTADDRNKAPLFHQALKSGRSEEEIKSNLHEAGFKVDYIENHNGRVLGAVKLGKVRLIDNVEA